MSEEPPKLATDAYDDPPDPYKQPLDEYDAPPERPLTPEEQALAFKAQLVLFLVMGLFIIIPFLAWWWLATHAR